MTKDQFSEEFRKTAGALSKIKGLFKAKPKPAATKSVVEAAPKKLSEPVVSKVSPEARKRAMEAAPRASKATPEEIRRANLEADPSYRSVMAKNYGAAMSKAKTSAAIPKWLIPAGITAAGVGTTAAGTALGHKKGKKKGRREGARVGFNVGSRAGYRSGARRGYVAGQKAMLSRIKEYKSSQAKKGGKEKAAAAVIPTWLLTQLIP